MQRSAKRLAWYIIPPCILLPAICALLGTWVAASGLSVRPSAFAVISGVAASGLLGGLFGLFMAKRIAAWLSEISKAAEGYLSGDFSRRLPAASTRELNQLVFVFNRMAEEFEQRLQAVHRQRHELDTILSSMVEGVIALDNEERILSINRTAAELFHVSFADVRMRTIQEGIRNADLQRCVRQALLGSAPTDDEIVLFGPEERFLRVQAAPLMDDRLGRIGVLLVIEDRTHVQKLQNARRDFVANVSHEIRTPVTSIKGCAETLLEGAMDDPIMARTFLETIGRQSDRLCLLVDDVLALSRLDRSEGLADIPFETVSLRPLIESAVRACAAKAETKGMRFAVACERDVTVHANASLLEQAVINLVDNAIKYGNPDTKISVSVEQTSGETHIAVRDNGPGIAPQHLPRIFERFYRIDHARSRNLGGTGLGLAIVKHIMSVHGGSVTVDSVLGEGTLFTLRLPNLPSGVQLEP